MPGRELRAEARIAVSRKGNLNSGESWFPCMILDMSTRGFQVLVSRELAVGQFLDFRCELFPEKVLDCKLEIRHSGDSVLGTKIVEIDKRSHDLCELFLQEEYSHKLNRFG